MLKSPDALLLWAALVVLAASVLLIPSSEAVWIGSIEVPPLCIIRRLTDWSCPGCGLTRSFVYMGHGQVGEAFQLHLLGPLLYGVVALQVPWRVWRLWCRSRIG